MVGSYNVPVLIDEKPCLCRLLKCQVLTIG